MYRRHQRSRSPYPSHSDHLEAIHSHPPNTYRSLLSRLHSSPAINKIKIETRVNDSRLLIIAGIKQVVACDVPNRVIASFIALSF